LRLLPTLRHTLALTPAGIKFCGLQFFNEHLGKIARRFGAKFTIEFRYNPTNLIEIYAFDPGSKSVFVVPSLNPEYTAGLSLYQHRLILKMLRQLGKKNPIMPEFLEQREMLRHLVEQCAASSKMFERRHAAKAGKVPGEAASPIQAKKGAKPEFITDLEKQVDDIADVQLEEPDEDWYAPEMA
jgi:hypothetical protein